MNLSEVIKMFGDKGYLVDASLVGFNWENFDFDAFFDYLNEKNIKLITLNEINKFNTKPVIVIKKHKIEPQSESDSNVEIINSFKPKKHKLELKDWTSYYNNRYEQIRDFLKARPELNNCLTISRVLSSPNDEFVSTIGIVRDVRRTKKNNYFIELEDSTGEINVIVTSRNKDVFSSASEIVFDEVIGVVGVKSNNFLFANNIIFPDIPNLEEKNSPEDVNAVFISDVHIGSKMFLEKEFQKFIDWVNGRIGNKKHVEMAEKLKYIFVVGDLVDGVGIYPFQEKELSIKDIYKQYEVFSEYISQIPEHIKIIVSPGNHDAVRLAEPQPIIDKEFIGSLKHMKNVIMVSNPYTVNIHHIDGFDGFKVLGYHGYSYDYYANNIEKIRNAGGYDAVDELMKFLLKKRHLTPVHQGNPIIPMEFDHMVTNSAPAIFVSGHIHKSKVGTYKNVINVCSSCFQSRTVFQEKVGHHPEPARVPIINLKTRKIIMMNFSEN